MSHRPVFSSLTGKLVSFKGRSRMPITPGIWESSASVTWRRRESGRSRRRGPRPESGQAAGRAQPPEGPHPAAPLPTSVSSDVISRQVAPAVGSDVTHQRWSVEAATFNAPVLGSWESWGPSKDPSTFWSLDAKAPSVQVPKCTTKCIKQGC